MAKNLGLGRMARRALQPLIQILVADPLMYKLQEDYRPKRIGAMPAIKKYFRRNVRAADAQGTRPGRLHGRADRRSHHGLPATAIGTAPRRIPFPLWKRNGKRWSHDNSQHHGSAGPTGLLCGGH